ncbi:positive regulator of chea protein activity (chew) [hydrocarbon metagenome]|uniref:Positive regulator of chea protein activity (Chew) n=1 Tax=hydrocarbon metagenome TaxID=938273 RepID=A0A0W8E9D0_9ZZZZ
MADEIQLVVFTLNNNGTICEYGVPIVNVQEIIPMSVPTKVPGTPGFVEGIINLRGQIIPIIDLKKKFNMGSADTNSDARSVVVEVEGQTVGIIVDEVSEVLRLPVDGIEPPPGLIGSISEEFITGVGKHDGRLLILLDMNKILNDTEKADLAVSMSA